MALIKPSSSLFTILVIVGLIIAASFTFVGGFGSFPQNPPTDTTAYQIKDSNIPPAKNSLQLRNPIIVTPTPTTTPTKLPFTPAPTPRKFCNHDTGSPTDPSCPCNAFSISVKYRCESGKCAELLSQGNTIYPPNDCNLAVLTPAPISITRGTLDFWCSHAVNGSTYCNWKPVIYLYPTKPTLVDVSVETSGEIVVSDPLYPIGGWKSVVAYPDGKLKYNNQIYKELFYETSLKSIGKPLTGIVVKLRDVEKILEHLTNELGLIPSEQKELVDFWVPKLSKLNSDYILISLVDRKEKDKTDKININPKPDSMIDFNFYFKPLDKPINIKPLNLPPTPKRTGFTVVEWGGTIDYEK